MRQGDGEIRLRAALAATRHLDSPILAGWQAQHARPVRIMPSEDEAGETRTEKHKGKQMASGLTRMAMPHTRGKIRLGIAGIALIALLILLAVGAFFGGWELMHPAADGSGMGMPLEFLKNSPFTSYFIPGLLLFVVFGVGSAAIVVAALLRHWTAPYLAFAIGQVIWIAVELAMTQQFHPVLQPALFALGAAVALLAYVWHRSSAAEA